MGAGQSTVSLKRACDYRCEDDDERTLQLLKKTPLLSAQTREETKDACALMAVFKELFRQCLTKGSLLGVSVTSVWEPSALQFASHQSVGLHVCERATGVGKVLPATNETLFFSTYFDNADRNESLHRHLAENGLAPDVECVEKVNWANGCPLRAVLSRLPPDAVDAAQFLSHAVASKNKEEITDTLDAILVFLDILADKFVLTRVSLQSLFIKGADAERVYLLDTSALVHVSLSTDEKSHAWTTLISHSALLEAITEEVPEDVQSTLIAALAACTTLHPSLKESLEANPTFEYLQRTLVPLLQVTDLAFARKTLVDLDSGYNRGVSENLINAFAPDVNVTSLCERTALAVLDSVLSDECKSTCLSNGEKIEGLYAGGEFIRFSSLWQLSGSKTLRVMVGELAQGTPNIVDALAVEREHSDIFPEQSSAVCEFGDGEHVCVATERLRSFQQELIASSYSGDRLVRAFEQTWTRLCSMVAEGNNGVFCFLSSKVSWDQVFLTSGDRVKFVDLVAGRSECSTNARATLLKAAATLTRDLLYLAMVDTGIRSQLFDALKRGIDGIEGLVSWNSVMFEVSNLRMFGRFSAITQDEWEQGSYTLHPPAGDQSIAALTNEFDRALKGVGGRGVEERRWVKTIERQRERFLEAQSEYKRKRQECRNKGKKLTTRRARNFKQMKEENDYGVGHGECS